MKVIDRAVQSRPTIHLPRYVLVGGESRDDVNNEPNVGGTQWQSVDQEDAFSRTVPAATATMAIRMIVSFRSACTHDTTKPAKNARGIRLQLTLKRLLQFCHVFAPSRVCRENAPFLKACQKHWLDDLQTKKGPARPGPERSGGADFF